MNLVGAFAYRITVVDGILAHWDRYFADEKISTKDITRQLLLYERECTRCHSAIGVQFRDKELKASMS
jgi:hypothetical protein